MATDLSQNGYGLWCRWAWNSAAAVEAGGLCQEPDVKAVVLADQGLEVAEDFRSEKSVPDESDEVCAWDQEVPLAGACCSPSSGSESSRIYVPLSESCELPGSPHSRRLPNSSHPLPCSRSSKSLDLSRSVLERIMEEDIGSEDR